MKTNLRLLKDANRIEKAINNYELGYTPKRFKAIRSKSLGSYVFNVNEIDGDNLSPTLVYMDHMLALAKIHSFNVLISVDIETNTPHYFVY